MGARPGQLGGQMMELACCLRDCAAYRNTENQIEIKSLMALRPCIAHPTGVRGVMKCSSLIG